MEHISRKYGFYLFYNPHISLLSLPLLPFTLVCLHFAFSVLSLSSRLLLISQGHTDELWGLDIHPSMEQFVTCGQDKQVHLWDTNSHQPLWSKTTEVLNLPALLCSYSPFEYTPASRRELYLVQIRTWLPCCNDKGT
jgi:WD40 repeat protein